MDPRAFRDQENWLGSFYELAIEYAPYGDDERLLHAQRALWSAPSLDGPYEFTFEPSDQPLRLMSLPTSIGPTDVYSLHGVLHLSRGRSLGVKSVTIREEDRSDWLVFCVPLGMLELVYPHIEYPLKRAANPWMDEVDQVLLEIAESVYAAEPFDLALMGEEVSGVYSVSEVSARGLPGGGFLTSAHVASRIDSDTPSNVMSNGLRYFLPTY